LKDEIETQMKKRFNYVLDIQQDLQHVLNGIMKEEFQECFQQWENCWVQCITSPGEYSEQDTIQNLITYGNLYL